MTIDGVPVTVPQGSTILEACRAQGIDIPTLCYGRDPGARGRLPDVRRGHGRSHAGAVVLRQGDARA